MAVLQGLMICPPPALTILQRGVLICCESACRAGELCFRSLFVDPPAPAIILEVLERLLDVRTTREATSQLLKITAQCGSAGGGHLE